MDALTPFLWKWKRPLNGFSALSGVPGQGVRA